VVSEAQGVPSSWSCCAAPTWRALPGSIAFTGDWSGSRTTQFSRNRTVSRLWLRWFRIHVGAHHFDSSERLVALHPGIVSGWVRVRLARDSRFFGAVLHPDRNSPRDCVPHVGDLTLVGLDDRLDAFRPAPPGLEVESPNRESLELNDLDPSLVRGANLVGRAWDLTCSFITLSRVRRAPTTQS
jgi:hypothetical protein